MGEVQWIKLYIDMFDKRKINKIRRLPAGNDILLLWVMLLATAGKCNAGGMIFITERVPFTKEDLADEFDFEISTIELALKAFVEYDMIELSEDGFISVCNWEEYQSTDRLAEIREKTRKRVAAHREKKRLAECNDTCNADVTLRNAIEEEKERDEEKEFHSINHSDVTAYIQRKVEESELEGADADAYKKELQEGLKLKYMGGTLGQGIIFMSDEQFSDLCDKLDIDEIEKYFGIIVDCERRGKHYKKKSHYQAVLDMAAKDRSFPILPL